MANPAPAPDRLESLADLIAWLKECATNEVGASPELREKLEAAEDQAQRDLDARNLSRTA